MAPELYEPRNSFDVYAADVWALGMSSTFESLDSMLWLQVSSSSSCLLECLPGMRQPDLRRRTYDTSMSATGASMNSFGPGTFDCLNMRLTCSNVCSTPTPSPASPSPRSSGIHGGGILSKLRPSKTHRFGACSGTSKEGQNTRFSS